MVDANRDQFDEAIRQTQMLWRRVLRRGWLVLGLFGVALGLNLFSLWRSASEGSPWAWVSVAGVLIVTGCVGLVAWTMGGAREGQRHAVFLIELRDTIDRVPDA